MNNTREPTYEEMQVVLDQQKQAYINEGIVTAETRIDRIDRAIAILETNGTRLTEAMMADFGHRSIDQSRATDIEGSIGQQTMDELQTNEF